MSKNFEIYKEILEREEKDYSQLSAEALTRLCGMKDRTLKQYARHLVNARDVIDLVADYIGISDQGLSLYEVYEDGTTPVLEKLKQYLDNGGDKVKLRKRVAELEAENTVLRSLNSRRISSRAWPGNARLTTTINGSVRNKRIKRR